MFHQIVQYILLSRKGKVDELGREAIAVMKMTGIPSTVFHFPSADSDRVVTASYNHWHHRHPSLNFFPLPHRDLQLGGFHQHLKSEPPNGLINSVYGSYIEVRVHKNVPVSSIDLSFPSYVQIVEFEKRKEHSPYFSSAPYLIRYF